MAISPEEAGVSVDGADSALFAYIDAALEAELTRAKAKADRYESLLDLRHTLDRLGVQDYPAPEFRARMDKALCEE